MHPGASNPCIFDLCGTSRNAGSDNSDTRSADEECVQPARRAALGWTAFADPFGSLCTTMGSFRPAPLLQCERGPRGA